MARQQRPWFRFYVEAVGDPKLRRRTAAQRWLWVAILAAARKSPVPGVLLISEKEPMEIEELADFAGMTISEVTKALPLFMNSGMLHRDSERKAWVVTHFTDRQYDSDNVTERTRKHRSNHPPQARDGTFQRGSQERSPNGDGTVLGTMTDTDSDSDSPSTPLAVEPPAVPTEKPETEHHDDQPQPPTPTAPPWTTDPLVNRWCDDVTGNHRANHRLAIWRIIDHLRQHVNDNDIDETIGRLAKLDFTPTNPNYLLTTVTNWAAERHIKVPPIDGDAA